MSSVIRFGLILLTVSMTAIFSGVTADAAERHRGNHSRCHTVEPRFGLSHTSLKDHRPRSTSGTYRLPTNRTRSRHSIGQSRYPSRQYRKSEHFGGHRRPRHSHGLACYWNDGGYRIQTYRQWVPLCKVRHYVPPVYRDVYDGSRCQRVLVSEGYHAYRILSGHYETRSVRTCPPGHWSCRF